MQSFQVFNSNRPWGSFRQFTENQSTTVKIIRVHRLKRSSYQVHKKRDEFWRILNGMVRITIDSKTITLSKDDELYVKAGTKHRFEGLVDSEILEISFGDFNESDIIRLNDDFDRGDIS